MLFELLLKFLLKNVEKIKIVKIIKFFGVWTIARQLLFEICIEKLRCLWKKNPKFSNFSEISLIFSCFFLFLTKNLVQQLKFWKTNFHHLPIPGTSKQFLAILMKMNIEDDSLNLICCSKSRNKSERTRRSEINFLQSLEGEKKRIKFSHFVNWFTSPKSAHTKAGRNSRETPDQRHFWDWNWNLIECASSLSLAFFRTKVSHGNPLSCVDYFWSFFYSFYLLKEAKNQV